MSSPARGAPRRRGRPGRPRQLAGDLVIVSGYVPAECVRALRRLGEGNVSEGLRRLWNTYNNLLAQAQSGAMPPPQEHRSPSSPRTPSRDRIEDEWPAEAPPDDW